jgi:phosphate ABC transporter phosphate-binding protein
MEYRQGVRESWRQPRRRGSVATRILIMLVLGAAIGTFIYFSPRLFSRPTQLISNHPKLMTGGTSVIFVVTENLWKAKYSKAKEVDLICESAGTTAGVEGMIGKKYTIAFTHAPVSPELLQKAKEAGCGIVHVPLFLCGVVPAYHISGLKDKLPKDKPWLNFTGKVLADIFLGKIKQWDDPALKELNPGVTLPAKLITVVHRKESSGTTQLFTEYLAAVSPGWKEQVGPPAAEVKWPVGEEAERNQGMAAKINEVDGAIGYIDLLYTSFQDIKLDYGAVQNKDKVFVHAERVNLTAAARAILGEIPDDLTFDLIDKPGKESYPISGVIYAVCSDKQSEKGRKQVVDFLHWATTDGQADVEKTVFAPLPRELTDRVGQNIDKIHAAL